MLLALALVLGQYPQHALFEQPNLPRQALAFFEAFPASGAGVGAACACTTPSGAKGEALTFSRASTQTCTRTIGVEPQATNSGDLVSCASGQPVVMPGADGTGVSGLLVEGASTNRFTRSESLNDAAWVKYKDGASSAPVVTADAAPAPQTSPTYSAAEQVDFGATIAGQSSIIYQSACSPGAVCTVSFYVEGVSGGGTLDVCGGSTGAACEPCVYNATTWTRCSRTGLSNTAPSAFIGNATFYNGGTVRQAQSAYVWGAYVQNVSSTAALPLDSYVPTDATTASRVAGVPTMPVTLAGNVLSIGETWLLPTTLTASASAFTVAKDASNYVVGYNTGGAFVCDFVIGGVTSSVTGPAMTAGTAARVACTYDANGRSACVNGTCTTTAGALTLFTGASSFYFGTRTATGNEARAVVKRACLDQGSASRCVL